ncbi:hypothetical protein [Cellulomonas cellasea]|uniref:Uncharacterized BrkB/YihY/UPF0761 family membrane protein n=1 Tax=Cellulomonas cellasea TaxID=43670 RepID=A0A7W4YDD4_9CELL|nr:hypothetical protein [Cellulomonas cellasea]MBB2924431.1 uncharacterized BrkB/YihY/UPF0761 family membrane protein [Cellulomonas cellasea]
MLADLPSHAVVGHLVVIVAPIAALLAATYALGPRTRRLLRWPVVAGAALTFALAVWAGQAGQVLLAAVQAAASGGEPLPAAVDGHAHGASMLSAAAFVLLVAVAALLPRVLAPGRPRGRAASVGAAVLALCALGTLVTTATTLVQAMEAVWSHHPGWS